MVLLLLLPLLAPFPCCSERLQQNPCCMPGKPGSGATAAGSPAAPAAAR